MFCKEAPQLHTEGKCEQAVIVEAMEVMVPKGIPEGWDVDGRKFHWRDEGMLRWSSGFFSSSPNGKEAGTLKLKDDKSGNFSPVGTYFKGKDGRK